MNDIKQSPSQLINLPYYFLCLLLTPFIIGIFMFIHRYLITKYDTFYISLAEQRIILSKGVFSKVTNDIELYRIKDITLIEPFWLRLVGLSNIKIISSDATMPEVTLKAVKNGNNLVNTLRTLVELRRDEKNVLETDMISK
jgi:uncharacterized membrane protein YdbT with pleckstrin-like domain